MNYISENFQIHYLPSYSLLVNSDFVRDTLIIIDDQQVVQAHLTYASDNPNVEAMKLLGLPFQHVFINVPTQSLVFIPQAAYQQEDQELYQEFMLDDSPTRTYHKSIDSLGLTAVYQYDLMLYNKWKSLFPNAVMVADFDSVLALAQTHIPIQGEVMGIHFNDSQLDIYVFIHGQFTLYTTFEWTTAEDIHYYILTVMQSLQLTNTKVYKLIISGLASEDPLLSALSVYAQQMVQLAPLQYTAATDYEGSAELTKSQVVLNALACA